MKQIKKQSKAIGAHHKRRLKSFTKAELYGIIYIENEERKGIYERRQGKTFLHERG